MFTSIRLFFKKIIRIILSTPEKNKTVTATGISKGLKNVTFEGKNSVPDRCNFSGKIRIGYATTLGYNNFLHGDVSVGRYCQFGADVALHANNHPVTHLSTYINKNLFNGELKAIREFKKITIGNDVWIGHNVIIIGNVTVGNGAILAAGSVVTKDVPSYSIVGGVPGKVIKQRFSSKIIKEIEALAWWDLPTEKLEKIKPLFLKDFENAESIYD